MTDLIPGPLAVIRKFIYENEKSFEAMVGDTRTNWLNLKALSQSLSDTEMASEPANLKRIQDLIEKFKQPGMDRLYTKAAAMLEEINKQTES